MKRLMSDPLVIVSHDAGGAEILSSYVRRNNLKPLYVLDGPALKIFERKLGKIENLTSHQALNQASSVLCGTSWQSDLEYSAIKYARNIGKPTVAFLDHWVNYRERFSRNGEIILPDKILVGDQDAELMAKILFDEHLVVLEDNPYFSDIRDEVKNIVPPQPNASTGISILYVCEPVSEHAKLRFGDAHYWGYDEQQALRYFLENISIVLSGRQLKGIKIRPHPSESIEKYDWARDEFALPIVAGGGDTLLNEIMFADIVVGCESMAMVVGLLAGKRVLSCIPPSGRGCVLPQSKIEKLRELIKPVLKDGHDE